MGSFISKTINKWFYKSEDKQLEKQPSTDDTSETTSSATDDSSVLPNSEVSSNDGSNTQTDGSENSEDSSHSSDENNQSSDKTVSSYNWDELSQHRLLNRSQPLETSVETDKIQEDIGQIEVTFNKPYGEEVKTTETPKISTGDKTVITRNFDKRIPPENQNTQTMYVESSIEQSNNGVFNKTALGQSTRLFSTYVEDKKPNDQFQESGITSTVKKIVLAGSNNRDIRSKVTSFDNWSPSLSYTQYNLKKLNNNQEVSVFKKQYKFRKNNGQKRFNFNNKSNKASEITELSSYGNIDKDMSIATNREQSNIQGMKKEFVAKRSNTELRSEMREVQQTMHRPTNSAESIIQGIKKEFVLKHSNTTDPTELSTEIREVQQTKHRPWQKYNILNKDNEFDSSSESKDQMVKQPFPTLPSTSNETSSIQSPALESYKSQNTAAYVESQKNTLRNVQEMKKPWWLPESNKINDDLSQPSLTTKEPSRVDSAQNNIKNNAKQTNVSPDQIKNNFIKRNKYRHESIEPRQTRRFSLPQPRQLNSGEGFIMFGKRPSRPYQPTCTEKEPAFTNTSRPIYPPDQNYNPSHHSNAYNEDMLQPENYRVRPWFNGQHFKREPHTYNKPENVETHHFTENMSPYRYHPQHINTQPHDRAYAWPQHPNINVDSRRYNPRGGNAPWRPYPQFENHDDYEIPPEM